MAKSLQEQLLQSGVAKPKQAKKARREKAVSAKAARREGRQPEEDQALQREIAAAQAEKRARDRELNARQKAEREARELAHSVAQIIERNRVEAESGPDAVTYNYTLGSKIHRMEVSDDQRRDLAAGRLAIVRIKDVSTLLPRAVGLRLMEKIPDQVWLADDQASGNDADDAYAEYQVPDDLMW